MHQMQCSALAKLHGRSAPHFHLLHMCTCAATSGVVCVQQRVVVWLAASWHINRHGILQAAPVAAAAAANMPQQQ